MMHRLAWVLAVFTLVLPYRMVWAVGSDHRVHVGVLSFRPVEQTRKQWQATANYLESRVPGYRFVIEPMYFNELDRAVHDNRFDFLLTNPEHYVTTRADYGLAAIATLMPLAQGHPVSSFGGVILARADRADINALADIPRKVVASVAEQSFGGYLVQRWTLFEQGYQIGKVRFTGMPQDKVVLEVLSGQADVGFVRTGVLESMAAEGKIQLDQFKILNQQPESAFPQIFSTELYPEWAFSAMPDVPEALVKSVALALFNIKPEDEAARTGKYYGFTPPGNYAPVEAVMLRLRVSPEQLFDLRDVTRKYAYPLLTGTLVLLLAALGVAFYLARTRSRLQVSLLARDELARALQQANATLEDKVRLRTQELQSSEARFRNMFEHHSSPMMLVDPKTGDIVRANRAAARFYGYTTDEMSSMHITQINEDTLQHDAEVREFAQRKERNYFTCTHRLASGVTRTVEVYASPVDVDGRELLFSIAHDITERKQLEEQMHGLAFFDALTRLPNRRMLIDRLGKMLAALSRHHHHGALMFLDLDHFKRLNDLHGHDVGDQLLVEVAHRLLGCIRAEDSAARLGGDEFVVMLDDLSENLDAAVVQAEGVAEKIREALSAPYSLRRPVGDEGELIEHHCSSSIGVTVFNGQNQRLDELLRWTDMAMYQAKDAGRNLIRFFDPKMQLAIEARAAMERDLRVALEQHQFCLFFQVQVDSSGKAQGAEALLRWHHPQRGLVPPVQFIPMAEENGLIIPIGLWVLETACQQLVTWQQSPDTCTLMLSINVSAKQFRLPNFVDQVRQTLATSGADPTRLELELTESMVMENVEETIAKMDEIKRLGVRFSMDDFGTGYSSLSYLKRFPLDQVKIDQSFVRDITTDQNDAAIVETIIVMAHSLGLTVIAEGVETEEQREFLEQFGCHAYQGYLFGKPVPMEAFEQVLRR